MTKELTPGQRAFLDQWTAEIKDEVLKLADRAANHQGEEACCDNALCPGPEVIIALMAMADQPALAFAFTLAAIRMLGDARKQLGEADAG